MPGVCAIVQPPLTPVERPLATMLGRMQHYEWLHATAHVDERQGLGLGAVTLAGKGGPALGGPLDTRGSAIHPAIEFRVDSQRVKLVNIGGISVGEAAFAGQPGPPTLDRIEISGPYNAKGVSETPSQRRIFVCRPTAPQEEPGCASKILLIKITLCVASYRPSTYLDLFADHDNRG